MVVRSILFLVGALCWGGTAAAADITARYVLPTVNNAVMTIQADDHGNSRTSLDGNNALVVTAGVAYFVMTDEEGLVVVRRADMMAVMADAAREMTGAPDVPAGAMPELPDPSPTAAGSETVAGFPGRRWSVAPDRPGDPGDTTAVLSDDPGLAPIGRAVAVQFEAFEFGLGTGYSVGPGGLIIYGSPAALALLRSGTLLRYGNVARLDSVSRAPIPASTFALPGSPLTRVEFAARLRRMLTRRN